MSQRVPIIQYRPWGQLGWLLPKLNLGQWSLLGSLATEDRCLATWQLLRASGLCGHTKMVEIEDDTSVYLAEARARVEEKRDAYLAAGGTKESIVKARLFSRFDDIVKTANEFGANAGDNAIIDISCLPKRYFFAFVRHLREKCPARNLIVACATPSEYAQDGNPLAEDPEPWRHLPGFIPPYPEPANPIVLIGIGYETLGLPQIYESGGFDNWDIKLLFPFPSQPSGVRRNWEFAHELSGFIRNPASAIERVDASDVSETFQYIKRLTGQGARYAILAPFGPKSLSLAMCLYATSPATKANTTVFYTQPRAYHPNYSRGVKQINGVPQISAYCIRLDGVDLYLCLGCGWNAVLFGVFRSRFP